MSNRAKTVLLLLVDVFILFASLTAVISFRGVELLDEHYRLFSAIFPLWLLLNFIEGLYTLRTYNPANLPLSCLRSTALSVIVSILFIYLFPIEGTELTPKTNLALIAALALPLTYGWRKLFFNYFSRASR